MGWVRNKAIVVERPPAPSFKWWLLAGLLATIIGILLFILHLSGKVNALLIFNIWLLALIPLLGWYLLFCIRGWLWGQKVNKYDFLKKEAELGQKQWESWAERHVAILASCVLLPEGVTAHGLVSQFIRQLPTADMLARRVIESANPVKNLLSGVQSGLSHLPDEFPLKVTIITDTSCDGLVQTFTSTWETLFPQRAIPDEIVLSASRSMHMLEDRLKQPDLTVELLLVMQLHGGTAYSDGLAALLLTSDDVAQKYQLPHVARLLRPMALDMTQFTSQLTLFLETQTVARQTSRVFCDSVDWHDYFAELLTTGAAHHARWKPEEIGVLERWCGIPGPGGGWLLAALLADVVNISNTPVLGLFTSATDHFVSTITPGSENQ